MTMVLLEWMSFEVTTIYAGWIGTVSHLSLFSFSFSLSIFGGGSYKFNFYDDNCNVYEMIMK